MTTRKVGVADTPQKERDMGLPRVRVGGRFVTAYDPGLALKVCERVAEGETLKALCEAEGMPSRQTFHRWVVSYPELSRAYRAARELSAYSLEEEALNAAREVKEGDKNSAKVRAFDVYMTQLRWSAAKRNPTVFSEKATVAFTVPIQINTTLDLGGGPEQEFGEHPDIYSLEATIVVPNEEDPGKKRVRDDTPFTKVKRDAAGEVKR